jgi:hypothetical protein
MAAICQPQEKENFESTHPENGYSFEETFKMFMPENCEFYNYNSTVCCGDGTCEYRNCAKKNKNFIDIVVLAVVVDLVVVVGIQHVVEFHPGPSRKLSTNL